MLWRVLTCCAGAGVLAVIALHVSSAAADELITVAGDRLTGKILEVGCDGVRFEYLYSQRLLISLGAVQTAQSEANIPVMVRGGDRLNGLVSIQSGGVQVRSTLVGIVTLRPDSLAPIRMVGNESATTCGAGLVPVPSPQAQRVVGGGAKPAAPVSPVVAAADEPAVDQSEQITPNEAAPAPEGSPRQAPTGATTTAVPDTSDNSEKQTPEFLRFLRSEAVLLPPRKVESDLALVYLHNKASLQNDTAFTLTTTARLGIINGLEGYVQVPVSWNEKKIQTFGGEVKTNNEGVGDLGFGLKYSVVPESRGVPNVIVSLSASAPTGKSPYVKPFPGAVGRDIRDPLSRPLGTGHWAVTGGVAALKSFDPLVFFSGVNYTHFFEETYYGVKVQPGDFYDLNAGLGFAVSETDTISSQVFVGYQDEWSFNNQTISASSNQPISLRLALTHILSPRDLIEPSVLFGLTRDANDAVVSLGYSHQF